MFAEFLDTFSKTVNPATSPVGVAVLEEIPEGLKVKVHGKKLSICQQIAYSRYYGWSTCATAEFSHCVLGAACAGLIPVPERVISGEVNCGVYQKDMPAAERMQKAMTRIPSGKKAVITFPLSRPVEGITPDAVVAYLNTAQSMRMIQAFLYRNGGELNFSTSGDAGVCSRGVAETIMRKKAVVEIPCLGDRRFAMAQDFEVITSFPAEMTAEVCEGLNATHKAGIRYPVPFQLPESCELPHTYTTYDADIC
jgi:uncharacterized protein (DUF169 family)